ncbi:unnamed protein product [Rotaria sordida]|nr:unnamed protein product [Rotaria sordida]CAF1338028.1 unnamed protein product [Rotaria sordida]
MSQRTQSIILSTTKAFNRMQKYKDVTNQTCLLPSLILYIGQFSTNLTRIVQTEVPFIEQELKRIVPDMNKLQNKIKQLTHDDKQQKIVVRFNKEQMQKFYELTNTYKKLNDEMFELNKKLMQMMNEILAPGISTVDEYNECMKLTARALIDYGYNQSVEHIDDDDVNEFLLSTDILLPNNRTDM